ncbi:hypothetical protein MJO28_007071 [Puccinia striiformis f. sp. tritici]|uniref:Uncharacterized protein n=1 Tax=Puccinia striiformis f. sp. tritici TaxID=168172 RepID=A0ACC0EG93_9BASI|nr:hypothetical protein MJO28_007071 [Puccinia striiformis f. sp. tritici]
MLLTKILVALQILHHYVISGHPLALSKPLVKRGETPIRQLHEVLQRLETHVGRAQCLSAITSALRQDASVVSSFKPFLNPNKNTYLLTLAIHLLLKKPPFNVLGISQFELSEDFIFGEDYIYISANFDRSERRMLQTIVEKKLENKGAGNPFVQMNTLRSILDDHRAAEVYSHFHKFPILLQSSFSDLSESQITSSHCPAYDLIGE